MPGREKILQEKWIIKGTGNTNYAQKKLRLTHLIRSSSAFKVRTPSLPSCLVLTRTMLSGTRASPCLRNWSQIKTTAKRKIAMCGCTAHRREREGVDLSNITNDAYFLLVFTPFSKHTEVKHASRTILKFNNDVCIVNYVR